MGEEKAYAVSDSVRDVWIGPYLDKALAERVLGIFKMAVDENSEMETTNCDPWAEQLGANLLPWRISIEILGGEVKHTSIALTWPPWDEGIICENDCLKEYFFWAASNGDAISKMASFSKGQNLHRQQQQQTMKKEGVKA
jgi:hypothetical protein